jgi:hypothetical protein
MRSARRLGGYLIGLAIATWACAAGAAELEIVNASLKAINHLYLAPVGAGDWGRDLLRGQQPRAIAAGNRRTITDLIPSTYDLRLVDEDGGEYDIEAIEVETRIKVELGDTQLAENAPSK